MPAGLTLRSDGVADADASLTTPPWAPSKLHRELFSNDRLGQSLVRAVRQLADGKDNGEFATYLEEIGVDALDGLYASLCVGTARGDSESAFELMRTARQIGTGQSSFDLRSALEDIRGGALPIFRESEVTPTVAVTIGKRFTDPEQTRADHRRGSLKLIRELGEGCDVILVAGDEERTFLWNAHRSELPESVHSKCNPYRDRSPSATQIESALDDAQRKVSGSKKLNRIVELVGQEPAGVLTYTRLEDELSISRGTVRGHAKRLNDIGLTDTINWYGETALELTPVGTAHFEAVKERNGLQSRIDQCVQSAGNCLDNSRVNPQLTRGGGDDTRHRMGTGEAVYGEYMERWRHAAVAGAAVDGGITLVDRPVEDGDDRRQNYMSYDADADRLVVGAEYDTVMQYWVCIARALTSPKVFDHAITPERLEGADGGLSGLLDDLHLLRNARCIGYLKDRDATPERFIARLQDAEDELCAMTSRLHNGDCESKRDLRSAITSKAHGLVGTMVHLCDLLGIDLVREVRLVHFLRDTDEDDREALMKTIGTAVAIQSRLGHFAAYRQLYESREEKRESAITPDVPADDPHGELIGSFVITGTGVGRLESGIRKAIRGEVSDYELHEDAPEFDVGVPIRTHLGRPSYAQAIKETLAGKHLSATTESVALMQALTATTYDAAQALNALGKEKKYPGRDIRVDELRVALSDLDPKRIMPDAPPSVSKMIHALLTVSRPVTQTEFAERADISAKSIRNHSGLLESLGLIEITADGYRLAISFGDERGTDAVVPDSVKDPVVTASDLLLDALPAVVGDAVWDLDHPIGAAFCDPSPPDSLIEAAPSLEPWVRVAVALTGPDADPPAPPEYFGTTPSQAPLPTEVTA